MAKAGHAFFFAVVVHLATSFFTFLLLSYLARPEFIHSDVSLGSTFNPITKRIVGSILMPLVISVPVFALGLLAKESRKDAS